MKGLTLDCSGFVGGDDLADNQPYAYEDRAENGVEPLEGHHNTTCACRNCFLSASSLSVTSPAWILAGPLYFRTAFTFDHSSLLALLRLQSVPRKQVWPLLLSRKAAKGLWWLDEYAVLHAGRR